MTPLLSVEALHVGYGRAFVVHGIGLHVDRGEMVALLGANGAGKTATLRAISRQGVHSQGVVRFDGADLARLGAADVARLGIAHVPEGRGTFGDLSVLDNLRVGAILRRDAHGVARDIERVHELFPCLAQHSSRPAGALSGGEQQMLAVGRALMMRPRLMLLDEPSFSVAPRVSQEIYELLAHLRRTDGLTALVVEQNADLALSCVDRAYVLESGSITLAGSAARLRDDPAIRQSYLGY
ncbi:MAG TPA: ABC transporter ATP-binding protein [Ramlibacter sp.]|uniref:ABC transporter ATP-binding protein n=1 Tax=Ramlibacter sp. TaxID=1917967 RepID=UPI002C51353C|nr:ABC transporter ATP-binding protein [Ramlibacter sp.]HVZ44267.1 ABC transporter ATP-binding protein [Ramlibacter sp.]